MPPSDILLIFVTKLLSAKYDFSSLQIKIHSILKIMFRLVFIWLCILYICTYLYVPTSFHEIGSFSFEAYLPFTVYTPSTSTFLWISSLTFCDCNQLKWSKNSENKCFNIHTFSSEEIKSWFERRQKKICMKTNL